MAELATIARPYADALFEAASASGNEQAWGDMLDMLAAVAADPDAQQYAGNPSASHDQIYQMIAAGAGADVASSLSTDAGKGVSNFLRTVIDNGRLTALPAIAAQYRELLNDRTGVADATIFSAFPISDSDTSELVATLERRFRRKLRVSVQVAPELIGGIRVQVGDEVLDTSVQGQLERMKVALTA